MVAKKKTPPRKSPPPRKRRDRRRDPREVETGGQPDARFGDERLPGENAREHPGGAARDAESRSRG